MPLLNAALAMALSSTPAQDDRILVAALDTAYQAAVERNDAEAMSKILHQDMIVVLGQGETYTRGDLLTSAREKRRIFEHQVEEKGSQTVRLYGRDTAVVTARLWLKGVDTAGKPFERRLWFSDTYVRTREGWRYAFGQASSALPPGAK